jgi:hypothetical protein
LWGIAADRNGSIYVGVVPFASGYPPLINVYAPGANGNAMPVQSIGGSNTDIHSTRGLALY